MTKTEEGIGLSIFWLRVNLSPLHCAYLLSYCHHTHTRTPPFCFSKSNSNLLFFWSTCSSNPTTVVLNTTLSHNTPSHIHQPLSPSTVLLCSLFHLYNHLLTNPLDTLPSPFYSCTALPKPPAWMYLGTFLYHICPWALEAAHLTSGNAVQTHVLRGIGGLHVLSGLE